MLAPAGSGWTLTGIAAFDDEGSTGLTYAVDLDSRHRTRGARIEGFRGDRRFHHTFQRKERGWIFDEREVSGLGDLLHLDFGFTPSTNLQQLRHADLAVGEEADIPAAWFDIGQPTLVRLQQHYRRVSEFRYHYSSPTASYVGVLELAPNGFVRVYPELWVMERDN